jgi:hypothetical protein
MEMGEAIVAVATAVGSAEEQAAKNKSRAARRSGSVFIRSPQNMNRQKLKKCSFCL